MKKAFFTGLALLLPVAITFAVISFLLNTLTGPFIGVIKPVFNSCCWTNTGLFFSGPQVLLFVTRFIVLLLLFILTLLLGFITHHYIGRWLVGIWDWVIFKIPFVRKIYKTCQEVVHTVLKPEANSFNQVVLVPYPNPMALSFGLVTGDAVKALAHQNGDTPVSVFIPATPNPTQGFLIYFPLRDIRFVDTTVEQALKAVISCGVMLDAIEEKLP